MTNSPAVASKRVRCGTARRSPRGSAARSRPRAHQLRVVLLLQRSRRQYVAGPGGRDAAPGRIDAAETAFASTADLASALRRAEGAHVEHQKRTGRSHLFHRSGQDENWPVWYAAYMVAEQAGTELLA